MPLTRLDNGENGSRLLAFGIGVLVGAAIGAVGMLIITSPSDVTVALPNPGPDVTVPKLQAAPAGKPMSAWRRAYIAKHGHQPPAPTR